MTISVRCQLEWFGAPWQHPLNFRSATKAARGCRAGVNKQPPIRSIVSKRPCQLGRSQPEQRPPCLVKVPVVKAGAGVKAEDVNKTCICLIITCSVRNKTISLLERLVDSEADMCAIMETWLSSSDRDQATVTALQQSGHRLHHVSRPTKTGGGVTVLYGSAYNIKVEPADTYSSFEHTEVTLRHGRINITLVVVYRPPSSGTEVFCDQFAQYMDQVVIKSQKLIVLGDFNFHCECVNDSATTKFRGLLDSLGLTQHVSSFTHKAGHSLDLVITHANEHLVNDLSVLEKLISDHYAVLFPVPYNRPSIGKKMVSFRKYKTIDLLELKHDVAQSALCAAPASS